MLDSAQDLATTVIGTPYYMSPELFRNTPYGKQSDVWALGCCTFEMMTKKHAFNARDINSLGIVEMIISIAIIAILGLFSF